MTSKLLKAMDAVSLRLVSAVVASVNQLALPMTNVRHVRLWPMREMETAMCRGCSDSIGNALHSRD